MEGSSWSLPKAEAVDEISSPWRHWVIRDLIGSETIREINSSWPPVKDRRWNSKKKEFSFKSHISDIREIGYPANEVLVWLNSKPFLDYLSALTGIQNILPDHSLEGGGLHDIRTGGYLKTHIDFNHLEPNNWHRRLNLLIYLNEDWEEEWGGALSLYKRKGAIDWHKAPIVSYLPLAGTSILFETTEHSFHGHPDPLKCPKDRSRRSIAVYYYTKEAPAETDSTGVHKTVYYIEDGDRSFEKKKGK